MNLQTGAFGDPNQLETLILFWSKMEELHYPGAGATRKYLEERLQQQQAMAEQQAMQQMMQQQQMAQQGGAPVEAVPETGAGIEAPGTESSEPKDNLNMAAM